MFDSLFVLVVISYLVVSGSMFLYGANFLYLTLTAIKMRHAAKEVPLPGRWPKVTVQLPIYNELYVAARLVEAAASLEYPPELLEIQVLDDSTDETVEVVRRTVEQFQNKGIHIVHIHRDHRTGYKAGALAEGLTQASGDFLAIFDADFVPYPDFLLKTVPYFNDSEVAFVQARWEHLNPRFSLLTRLQSLAIDAHFMMEQYARYAAHYWFNFNGTAGVWRKQAIEDAGGWKADTLTEDLDLSYRAFLRGWRAVFLRKVGVPAELPVSINAYRRQQQRWAQGSLECAARLLPQVWKSKISVGHKLVATMHLSGYGVHLLLFTMSVLYPFIVLFSQRYQGLNMTVWAPVNSLAFLFSLSAMAPTLLFTVAQQQLGRRWWLLLPWILFLTILGTGMMLNTVNAALRAISGTRNVFERTPKFGIGEELQPWQRKRYQLRLKPLVLVELLFALWNGATVWISVRAGNWMIAFYAAIFCAGLLFVSGMSIVQSLNIYIQQRQLAQPAAVKEM